MVVREDGTKWACQSCLKGHRVSGCTHTDRELTLVPKKGRPVTQCQHCRLERKKRSAHVKCDCGEVEKPHHSKEKCIHLREAEERAKAGYHDDHHSKEEDPHHLAAVAEEQGCCCGHGGKCSCSLIKKESPSRDTSTAPHGPAVQKPRLESTKSDGQITVFANGHHKPVHKRNHAAHECGMPYKVPVSRSKSSDQNVAAARRSVDSLALDTDMCWNSTSTINTARSLNGPESGLSRSEHPSPGQIALDTSAYDANFSSMDFPALGSVHTNQSMGSAVGEMSGMPPLDPMSALMDASYEPWSAIPSATDSAIPNDNLFGAWATNFDHGGSAQPALTAASSGTQSEIDELPAMDDFGGFMPSIQEDGVAFNHPDIMTGDVNNANRRSLPPGFFGNADFSMPPMPNEWQTPAGSMPSSDPSKSKAAANDQSLAMVDVWNTPTMPTMTSIAQAQRSLPNPSHSGRPQSHSIGAASAPHDDVIKQLFPDIEVSQGMFSSGLGNSPSMIQPGLKRIHGLPIPPTSHSTDVGPMDESNDVTSQPWNGGSLSVPADGFSTPYNLDQEFSSTDFNGSWPYQ